MVINTHHRFVFVHIPKTAGTSLMTCLSRLKGNHTRWVARTKHETLAEFERALPSRRSILDRILNTQTKEGLEAYCRFGFVRNPWDRMSSLYRFLVEKRSRREIDSVSSFRDFLLQAQAGTAWIQGLHSMRPQVDFFRFDDGTLRLDYLGHYEHLEDDLRELERRLGCTIALERRNPSSNSGRDFRADYDPEMVEIVRARFAEEIALFGYAFETRKPTKRRSGPIQLCPGAS